MSATSRAAAGRLRIGTSGYEYRHWTGVLYPAERRRSEWFAVYSEHFDTVELNNTFYRLATPEVFEGWRARTPQRFCYAVKMSRFATHMKRLRDPDEPIARFLDRVERLGPHLGPILIQLPPHWRCDAERLHQFLSRAPARHRWAVEVRDPSWLCEEVFAVLRRHRAALVLHDMIDGHPVLHTTDWCYLRFHGIRYGGGYSTQKLTAHATRIRGWLAEGRDVYAYFNNDLGGHAVHDALTLRRLLQRR